MARVVHKEIEAKGDDKKNKDKKVKFHENSRNQENIGGNEENMFDENGWGKEEGF